MLELREILGPELAGYAARRAGKREVNQLLKIAQELKQAREQPEKFQQLEYRFNQTLASASGNLAFQFLVNSIGSIYLKNAPIFRLGIAPLLDSAGKYLEVARAVQAGNEKKSRRLIRELFKESGRAFYKLIENGRNQARKGNRTGG